MNDQPEKKKSEIDDLLGSSDDDAEPTNEEAKPMQEVTTNTVPQSILTGEAKSGDNDDLDISAESIGEVLSQPNRKTEINDLLGDSDDDNDSIFHGADEAKETEPATQDSMAVEEAKNQLDLILGEHAPSEVNQQITKTVAQTCFKVAGDYRIPSDIAPCFVRTPNFMKIQNQEYDSVTYDKYAESEVFDGTTAVIRWRFKKDENGDILYDEKGNPIRESNARFIKWSDGSMQLIVGNAVFNAKTVTVDNCFVYEQKKVLTAPKSSPEEEKMAHYLECLGHINTRITLQPSSLDSEIHTRMSLKISEKFKKEKKIQDRDYEDIKENPEKTLALLAKKEEEDIRKGLKLKMQQELRYGSRNSRVTDYYKRPMMSADYLDDEPLGYDEDNIASIKRKVKTSKPRKTFDESEAEEDDEEEEELDDMIDDDDDEEEEEIEEKVKPRKKDKKNEKRPRNEVKPSKSTRKIESDDDDDDEDFSNIKKNKTPMGDNPDERSVLDEEDDEETMQQRKRVKRVVLDSDDEEE